MEHRCANWQPETSCCEPTSTYAKMPELGQEITVAAHVQRLVVLPEEHVQAGDVQKGSPGQAMGNVRGLTPDLEISPLA